MTAKTRNIIIEVGKKNISATPKEFVPYTKKEVKNLIDTNTSNIAELNTRVDSLDEQFDELINNLPSSIILDTIILDNYYTKDEINTNYYAKDNVDNLVSTVDAKFSNYYDMGEVEGLIEQLTDESLSNYYDKDAVDNLITNIEPDLSNYYNKQEVDDIISSINIDETDLSDYYTKEYIDSNYYTTTDIDERIANIPSSENVDLSDYYTSNEVDNLIAPINRSITSIGNNLSSNYLNKNQIATNYYDKNAVDSLIANIEPDLSDYYTSNEVDNLIAPINRSITSIGNNLSSNYLNKNQIATSYYNKTQIDSNLSSNYLNKNQIATNYYNKTQIDAMIANIPSGAESDTSNITVLSQDEYNNITPVNNQIYFIYEQ